MRVVEQVEESIAELMSAPVEAPHQLLLTGASLYPLLLLLLVMMVIVTVPTFLFSCLWCQGVRWMGLAERAVRAAQYAKLNGEPMRMLIKRRRTLRDRANQVCDTSLQLPALSIISPVCCSAEAGVGLLLVCEVVTSCALYNSPLP